MRSSLFAARCILQFRYFGLGCLALCLVAAVAPAAARDYLKADAAQKAGFTPGIVTDGGRIVWISGQIGIRDEQGNSMAGDFEGQARVIFRAIDAVAKRAGGSIKDVVNVTVYLTDPRLLEPLQPIRREFWPEGNFPTSTTITVHSLPVVGMMLEVSAIAVIGDR